MSTGISITGDSDFSAIVSFTNSTNSSSNSTGALIVTGGIGVTGKSYLGNTVFSKVTSVATNSPIENGSVGSFTTNSLSTAAGSFQSITLTNSFVLTTSIINLTASTSGTGIPYPYITSTSTGSVVIAIRNISSTTAFNNTIKINFLIF